MSELDDLDRLAAQVFEGYLVRKDLAQQFRGQYPVPTYVGEFLLGRYCATTDPDEIYDRYKNYVDVMIDAGFGGNEASTILDCTGSEVEVVREGKGSVNEL